MRKLIVIILCLLTWSASAQSGAIMEYFIDTDPGFGNGSQINLDVDNAGSIQLDLSAVNPGIHRLYVRSRDANGYWSQTLIHQFVKEQPTFDDPGTVTGAEYFFDSDPGFGNATALTTVVGDEIGFAADLSALADGLHCLYVRSLDSYGYWSQTIRKKILKQTVAEVTARAVVQAEYFIDVDPGIGNASLLTQTTAGQFDVVADITSLSDGIHTLYIRTKDDFGFWSQTLLRTFLKESFESETINVITRAEYFIDTDPGIGNGEIITDVVNNEINFSADLTTLSDGFHSLYVRAMDDNGIWSQTMYKKFVRQTIVAIDSIVPVQAEYFIDTDPGFGNGVSIAPNDTGVITFVADLSAIADGYHKIYTRVLYNMGHWSHVASRKFIKQNIVQSSINGIVQLEYYFDEDPGIGNATVISVDTTESTAEIEILAEIPALIPGYHTMYIRAKDIYGHWSMVQDVEFCNGAVAAFSVSDTSICNEGTIQFTNQTLDASTTTTYAWDFDGDSIVDHTSSSSATWYFENAGVYNATLTVEEEGGLCPNTYTQQIEVSQPLIEVSALLPDELLVNDVVELYAGVSQVSDNYSIQWSASVGSFNADTIDTVMFQSPQPGVVTIVASVTDINGCTGLVSYPLEVLPLIENFIVFDQMTAYRPRHNRILTQYLTDSSEVVWESMNPDIALVNNLGDVECISNGIAVIRGVADGQYTDEITVIVDDYIALEELVVPPSIGIDTGESVQIIAAILPRDASIQDVTWYSSDSTVATVDQTGLVTAVSQGTCNIVVVAADGNIPGVTVVTVNMGQVDVEQIVIPDSIFVSIGDTYEIVPEYIPYYASDRQIAWTSSASTVASVTNHGVVTALSAGEARIMATPAQGETAMSIVVVRNSDVPDVTLDSRITFYQDDSVWTINLNEFVADDNTADSEIRWIISGMDDIQIEVSSNNIATFTAPDSVWAGSDIITIVAIDADGLRTTRNIQIEVEDTPNQAPMIYFPDIILTQADNINLPLIEYIEDDQDVISELTIETMVYGSNTVELTATYLVITPVSTDWVGTDTIVVTVSDSRGMEQVYSFMYIVNPSQEITPPVISSIPIQYSNSFGEFDNIYLNRYVRDANTLPEDIYWTNQQSLRMEVRIEQNIVSVTSIDRNWIGSEQLWFYAENADGMVDSIAVIFVVQNSGQIMWEGDVEIDFFADRTLAPRGSSISLFASMTGAETWLWKIEGNGNIITSQELQPAIDFDEVGVYSVSLICQNGDNIDTLREDDYISIFGIVASDTTLCLGDSTLLTINSTGLDFWQWSTGSTATQVYVQPGESAYYSISVSKGLFVYLDSVLIEVSQPFQFATPQVSFCSGDSAIFNAGEYESYMWHDNSIDSEFVSYTEGAVAVTVTDAFACTWSDEATVQNVYELPDINLGADTAICHGDSIPLISPTMSQYMWSTGDTISQIYIADSGSYSVTVVDANTCMNSDELSVSVLIPYPEELGVCTYNDDGNSVVIAWQRTPGMRTDYYKVYRETDEAGNWVELAQVSYNDSTYYIDRGAYAFQQAYKYKLQTIDDVCGNVAESEPHRTMHLVRSIDFEDNSANLEWSPYEGISVSSYKVFRYRDGTGEEITSIVADDRDYYSFNDGAYQDGDRYRIIFNLPYTIELSAMKSESGPFSQSLSNITESTIDIIAIKPVIEDTLLIYPVPASEYLTVKNNEFTDNVQLKIYSIQGVELKSKFVSQGATQVDIDVSMFEEGSYILRIVTEEKETNRLFIIKR